jgi:hypothetical protein
MNSLFKAFHQRINHVFRDAIAFDVSVDLVLMIAVITQRIEDLRESQVWQMLWDLFRRRAHPPDFDDCPNRRSCAFDGWLTTQNLFAGDDVKVFCCYHHVQSSSINLQ